MNRGLVCSALLFALMTGCVCAQTYPAKVVRVIVPHPPGGPGDVPPRGIAQGLAQALGQPFVIENREGADGLIGAEACAKAAPDGYTLCATSVGTMLVNPAVRKEATYNLSKFAAVVHTGTLQQVILGSPNLAANSMAELLALAKTKPDSITVGTMGGVNLASLLIGWAKAEQGVRFYQIPFKSASQSVQSAMAGDVNVVTYAMGPSVRLVQSGKLKALALSPRANPAALPGVPGVRESGVGFEFNTWWGWFAPAGTPPEVVRKLNAEIAKLLADPAFVAKHLASQGLVSEDVTGAPPEAFERYIRQEAERFAQLMKLLDIKAQ